MEKQLSPRTVLSYRNALVLPLKSIFKIDFSHEAFSLLARSQFIARPPVRKSIPQWPLQDVLKGLKVMILDGSSHSSDILMKSLFLTALATGNRASELSSIDNSGINWNRDKNLVTLPVRPGFLFKNQRAHRAPPNIVLKSLSVPTQDSSLCPINSLKIYLKHTEKIRKGSSLFVSPTSGTGLKASSISLWLSKTILRFCPNSLPKAHDVRKQAASLAWVRGISPAEIIKAAFWSSSDIFIRSYLNPEVEDSVPCLALGS